MTPYTKILPWENARCLERLSEFRNLVVEYFNYSKADWRVSDRIEEPKAQEARVKINRMMDEVHDIILFSGVNPTYRWTPPPAVGGYVQNLDLVQNIFNLQPFQIAPTVVLDVVDRAIGIYEGNAKAAFLRAINPFFYIGRVFDFVARIPFLLIGRAGFNQAKAEASLIGRLIKGVIYVVTILASLLTVLQILELHGPIKDFVKRFL